MGTKHTPGPLEVAVTGMLDDFSGACSLAVVYSQDAEDRGDTYETALIVCAGDIDEEEARANAYLYAAAPDLLAACKLAGLMLAEVSHYVPDSEFEGEPNVNTVRDQLAAAIAKAEGQDGDA